MLAEPTSRHERTVNETKRIFYLKAIMRNAKTINDDAIFSSWSKGMIEEKLMSFEEAYKKFEMHCLNIECEELLGDEGRQNDLAQENENAEHEYYAIKAKLRDRLAQLDSVNANSQQASGKLQIEVQTNDLFGNIPNTWGQFDGDYAKWQSFRDRFNAAIHGNEKLKSVFKFQYLQAACVGEAKSALGDWDLTETNYEKAWSRLQSIYEDDYMQVQSFMRKLYSIPRMQNASGKAIRDMIDTVHQCVHGLSRYIGMDNNDAFVVFLVIDRMDNGTWEKYRPTLYKANDQAYEIEGIQRNIGKHIPTWRELEAFLEGEVTIHVHDEIRSEASGVNAADLLPSGGAVRKQPMQQRTYPQMDKSKAPGFLACVFCEDVHPIYKCNIFKALDLTQRRDHVIRNYLCERCLRQTHSGDCSDPKSMEQCPNCRKGIKHNSWLCPIKEAKMQEKQASLRIRNDDGDDDV